MNRDIVRQVVNVATFLVMVFVNGLANTLPLNGQTTAEISDRFTVFFVPAGYVFAIWGLIYLALLAFAIYQALPSQRSNPRLRRIGYLFALGSLANTVWIFLWHYNYLALTVVAMLILLLSLIAVYLLLDIGKAAVHAAEKWCVDIPFSIYLGWISVASIANISDWLYDLRWDGFGIAADVWAAMMLIVALLLTLIMIATRGDSAYSLVIIWAAVGIANKQAAVPTVANTAWLVALLVVLALAARLFMRRVQPASAV